MQHLKGKTVLITGAASGIGEATARLFTQCGALVILADIDEARGYVVTEELRSLNPRILFIRLDVTDPDSCEQAVKTIVSQFGRLDIAFNNAGIAGEQANIGSMSISNWEKVVDTNLNSVFYCMKYQLQQMEKQHDGVIINMSSILGKVGFANAGAYVAAKHGVIGLTETAALEYSSKGIRINSIGPAFIDTPLLATAGLDQNAISALATEHPVGRIGKSSEVAELVVWLSSPAASFVTGAYFPVDGGYLAK
ncbi:MAG: SDR family oxidoreductase [Chitinophagaceae bacterium]|nr:MAG: SDR family oxidoreductase [Chitinophagaceae bacterium]